MFLFNYISTLNLSNYFPLLLKRVLVDGIGILLRPLAVLFELIYDQCRVPDQWLVSKIIPIHKKGDKHKIEKSNVRNFS